MVTQDMRFSQVFELASNSVSPPFSAPARMAISLEKFNQHLTDSNLLSAPEVAALQKSLNATDSMQFAKALVKQKTLTKYQAEQVLSGKANSLVLGNYVILEKIGQGGMGQVLKAKHRRMDRTVALKILSPKVTKSPDAVQRFQREVKAAAKLEHPNIVTAYDADEANSTHFFVMQFVDGHDLSSIIKSHGRMTVPRAVHCLDQAVRGLQYAHERGIVHRDIKPANLLLSNDDQLKILDLGLATMADIDGVVDHGLTGTGAIMGTVDFMAPEQGVNTKRADARSDIYSLGCTFYYLLTAHVPFGGETAVEKILAHRDQPIPDLGKQRPDLPAPLLQMFRRMVAKEPADRYQTMGEVLAALRTVGAAGSTVIQPAGGSAPFDPALQKFFDAQDGKKAEPAALAVTVMQPEPAVEDVPVDTLNTASIHTDSLLTKRLTKTRTLQAPAGGEPPRNVRRWLMAAGGGLGGLLLFGIIIITITNKDGKKTTIKVPEGVETNVQAAPGSTVDIVQQNDTPGHSSSTSNTSGGPPTQTTAPSTVAAPDPYRRAAEAIIQQGGAVYAYSTKGYLAGIKRIEDLSDNGFVLHSFELTVDSGGGDEVFRSLDGVHYLLSATLTGMGVSDSQVRLLEGVDIDNLHLNHTSISDDTARQLSHHQDLLKLWFTDARITDTACGELKQLSRLRTLGLAATEVGDLGLQELMRMESLRTLSVGRNCTVRGLGHLQKLPGLQVLWLSLSQIGDEAVDVIAKFPDLRIVELEKSNFTAQGAQQLQAGLAHAIVLHPELQSLADQRQAAAWILANKGTLHRSIYGSMSVPPTTSFAVQAVLFGTDGPRSGVAQLRPLRFVEQVVWPNLTSADNEVEHLVAIGTTSVTLDNSDLTDAGLRTLAGIKQLEHLRLTGIGDRVSDTGWQYLTACLHLESLALGNSSIGDAGLVHLGNVTNLSGLTLHSCGNLTSEALKSLSRLSNLRNLILEYSPIGDAAVPYLAQMTSLRILHLHGTQFTVVGVEQLHTALPKCAILWNGGLVQPVISTQP